MSPKVFLRMRSEYSFIIQRGKMAAVLWSADLLQQSEALIDGKKINEAIDLLNGIGAFMYPSLRIR